MKNLVLPEEWQDKLEEIPETGPGYHVVDIELVDGSVLENVRIINGVKVEGIYIKDRIVQTGIKEIHRRRLTDVKKD